MTLRAAKGVAVGVEPHGFTGSQARRCHLLIASPTMKGSAQTPCAEFGTRWLFYCRQEIIAKNCELRVKIVENLKSVIAKVRNRRHAVHYGWFFL